jgi:hypothetical protein
MRTHRQQWLTIVVAAVIIASGCASTGTPKAIGPNDLPSLAGRWSGTVTLPSGRSEPGTLELLPSGDYAVQTRGFSAQGKAQVKDGSLTLVPTMTSGAGGAVTGPRSSVATLSERPDGTRVLSGSGHSSVGPFNFEVVRQK